MNMSEDRLTPSAEELSTLAEDLIREQNTMTLATALKDAAWAAPVYYVNLGFKFYFFSDPRSQHIQESLESKQAAAAIFAQGSTWKEIRGIQMSGEIRPLSPGMEAIRVLRAYLKKFPFTKEFFDVSKELDLGAFAERFKVRLYRFQPLLLYYMDNSISFSFREKVPL
ncbi:MAG: pyridoxamine 5'-phosphate oxidase family protein [Desulfobacterales bacterium]|nr:pyridoxamine 5'-phosphate oxidase family protein [Desulfobacterales bacterium]